MASRSELTKAGFEELGAECTTSEARLVRAFAAMLSAATTSKKVRDRAINDTSMLKVPPRKLYDAIRQHCGDKILCDPCDGRWFGRLGGVLKQLPTFSEDDVELLCGWINAGGVASWPQGVPTFSHLISHLDKWTAFAREWHRRGRQQVRGRTAVGAAAAAEAPEDFSAFKVPKLQ